MLPLMRLSEQELWDGMRGNRGMRCHYGNAFIDQAIETVPIIASSLTLKPYLTAIDSFM